MSERGIHEAGLTVALRARRSWEADRRQAAEKVTEYEGRIAQYMKALGRQQFEWEDGTRFTLLHGCLLVDTPDPRRPHVAEAVQDEPHGSLNGHPAQPDDDPEITEAARYAAESGEPHVIAPHRAPATKAPSPFLGVPLDVPSREDW